MIYRLYTENLPGDKVIGHAMVLANNKEWSFAHVCDNYDAATLYIEQAIANWAKTELKHYANQRKVAFTQKGCFNPQALNHYNNIISITRTVSHQNTWRLVLQFTESIQYFLPHKDSAFAGWNNVLSEIFSYAKHQNFNLKKSA